MYSILPGLVALVFLGYGCYAVFRKGFTRISTSFFVLCVLTFFWQFTWAVLYQIKDPDIAMILVRLGYLLILFLPTSMYHFLVEITERKNELRLVYLSYVFGSVLGLFLLFTNIFVSGHYAYFWGYYPKAGVLHPIHIMQATVVISRGLYITYQSQRGAPYFQRTRLRYCFFSLLVYFAAAIDYLCNYGVEFYPPGVIFISVSLGIMVVAIVKYRLMDNPMALAANLAHQVRTPLLTIQMRARAIQKYWGVLFEGYQLAVENGLCEQKIRGDQIEILRNLAKTIEQEVDHSYCVIDMLLASTSGKFDDTYSFAIHSVRDCIEEAVARYPFMDGEKEAIRLELQEDFEFYGSDNLLIYVVFNLIKNSLYSIKLAKKGDISIVLTAKDDVNVLIFEDTATGINEDILPHVFDSFFTTKKNGGGTGIGLAFCKQVMSDFQGAIRCISTLGESATFILEFPNVDTLTSDVQEKASTPGEDVLANIET